jgi:glycosyltransferase involved in cell wall biosynthesis
MLLHSLVLSPEQDILRPMIDVIKSKRPKVALLGGSGSDYADELFSFLDERFTAELLVGKGRAEAQPVIDWCDIAFFAGYSETLSEISFANRTCRIVAMLSEADVNEHRLANVHWDNVDTVIVLGGEGAKESLSDRLANLKNRTNVVSVLKGADTVRFKFAERVRGKRIACLGGLDVKSNPMLLLQCMQKLHYLDNDYRLYFAGEFADGATEDYVRYMADEMGLSNVVFFDGAIKDEAKWLRDKHYIAGASITGGGFGGILKGMSCGLRPVVHNFPGARDMLDSEFVFDLAEDFCEQILSGSYEPVRYRRIVEEGYSQQSQMEAINDVLFRLERELSRASGSVAASEGQDQYGWGPVGFDGSNRATREVESVAGGASDITFGRGTKEVSSKVIPIKPLDVSEYDLKVGRGEATGVAQSSEKANGIGSINEMSADVLRDWRAFSERMNGQPGSSEALDDVNAMADVSPSGVTPLDLSSRKSANGSNITELPTVGVSPGEKAEVSGVPFT